MFVKKLLVLFFVCSGLALSANASDHLFPLSQVRLLPSRFQDNFKRDSAWMMSIPVGSLLHGFQTSAGAFAGREGGYFTVRKLAGWESLDCDLRGHITGHLLSALATLYAQSVSPSPTLPDRGERASRYLSPSPIGEGWGGAPIKAKADSIVNGLNEVQRAYGRGGYLSAFGEGLIDRNIEGKSVWAPWYTLHKIVQGLIDQYTLCGNDTALAVARRMGDWAYNKLKPLSEETRRKMIRNEFGGFNDAMYQLYAITKDSRYLWVARFFYHNDKIDPLKEGNDDLGTNHANTFIPKLLGEAQNYALQGWGFSLQAVDSSRMACETLFNTLAFKHAFVTGEVSDKEHLFDPAKQSKHLTGYDGENCCTFNLLKLAEHVYNWNIDDPDRREAITGYYERALYNHILGQQDPATSMVCYFTPLLSGAYRLYSTRDSSFWCCVGSGFESHVRYAKFIYAHNGNNLYVNLLIPSRLDWDGTVVTQQTAFPESGKVTYTLSGKARRFNLVLRHPSWATSVSIKVNGSATKSLSRLWKAGDKVEVDYGMALHEETTKDDASRFAVMYGPIVLSGKLATVDHPFSDPKKYNDYYTFDFKIPETLSRTLGDSWEKCLKLDGTGSLEYVSPLHYKTPDGIELHPFYDAHHERYVVYWER